MRKHSPKTSSPSPNESARAGGNRPLLIGGLVLALPVWVSAFLGLQWFADYVTFRVLRLSPESRLGDSLNYFLYEAPKLLLTLVLVIFVFGIVRSFFSPESVRKLLAGRGDLAGSVLAAALGIFTPFCNCSAIPLFIGFVEAGVPLGVTFSFLIAAPMVNEVAVAMLFNMFGPKIGMLYAGTGLLIAVCAGFAISRLRMERFIQDWVLTLRMSHAATTESPLSLESRLLFGAQAARSTLGHIWPYLIFGIALGAAIHGYMPNGLLTSIMGRRAWWSVPAAIIAGVPVYSSAIGIIPVVQALLEKGAALGTVLVFMMSVTGLSLPEIVVLRKVLKPRLIVVFVFMLAISMLIVGLLFNALL